MLRADISESFPITVSLLNEITSELASGETVSYDIRDSSDNILSPPINGTFTESTVTSGVYIINISIPTSGSYICYASSPGYLTNTEDILISAESACDLVKEVRHYNTAIQDVVRITVTPTASQAIRNVPVDKTDYIITRVKADEALDWSSPTASGNTYAWYETIYSEVPYKMGGSV